MLKHLSFILMVIGLVWGCKKSESPPQNENGCEENQNTLTYSVSAEGDPSGTYNGVLMTKLDVTVSSFKSASAFFYNKDTTFKFRSFSSVMLLPTTFAGTVTLNNSRLDFDPSDSVYADTVGMIITWPAYWQVSGDTFIPGFSLCNLNAFPSFDISVIPNVIDISNNFLISLSQAHGYDQIELTITDNNDKYVSLSSARPTIWPVTGFISDTLAKLTPTSNATVDVVLIKYNPQRVSGKDFLFATFYTYSKMVVLQ